MSELWLGISRFRCTKRTQRKARMVELLPGDVVLRDAKRIDPYQVHPAPMLRMRAKRSES